MIIEGRIVMVMESWPPQLAVETQNGRYDVGLFSETPITRQGKRVGLGELRTDLRIRVEGQNSGPRAMIAQAIEILA